MWEILTGEEPYADMHCGAIIGKLSLFKTIIEGFNARNNNVFLFIYLVKLKYIVVIERNKGK